jgi:NADPH-dependent ferric siderophore reductase
MSVREPVQRRPVTTTVHSVVDVSDQMREIRLKAPGLARWRCPPGAHVVVWVPTTAGPARRVYSIWSWSPQHPSVTIRVAIHGAVAPGCAWALAVRPGDEVRIEPPRSKISIEPAAAFHLFAGDETAAVPLLAMQAAIHRSGGTGPRPLVLGVFEAPTAAAEVPGGSEVPALPWVHRGRASAVASPVLLRAFRELDLPAGTGTAYLAGESTTCRLLQRYLIETRGWPRRSVKVQPHWAPGRPGFGAGPDERVSEPRRAPAASPGPRRWN